MWYLKFWGSLDDDKNYIVGSLLIGLCPSRWKLTIRSLVEQGGMERWLTVGSTTPSK